MHTFKISDYNCTTYLAHLITYVHNEVLSFAQMSDVMDVTIMVKILKALIEIKTKTVNDFINSSARIRDLIIVNETYE